MSKIIMIAVIILLIVVGHSYSHTQLLHQYVVREAYNLLKMQLGADVPNMVDHIGIGETSGPWSTGKMVAGAWREDEEDVVYEYSVETPPSIEGNLGGIPDNLAAFVIGFVTDPFICVSHFWNPDDGDDTDSRLAGTYSDIYFVLVAQNAYEKLQKYYNGGFSAQTTWSSLTDAVGNVWTFYNILGQRENFIFSYNDLILLYRNSKVYINNKVAKIGDIVYPQYTEITVSATTRDLIVWEILGRMAHLITDLSVPAHAHKDIHGHDDPGIHQDSYEPWFNDMLNYNWDATLLYSNYGANSVLSPYYLSCYPLHYLSYTTAQISGYFGSNGPYSGAGNNLIIGNHGIDEENYVSSHISNLATYIDGYNICAMRTNDAEYTTNIKEYIRDNTLPQAIRATAGLLYWFACESGSLPHPRFKIPSIWGSVATATTKEPLPTVNLYSIVEKPILYPSKYTYTPRYFNFTGAGYIYSWTDLGTAYGSQTEYLTSLPRTFYVTVNYNAWLGGICQTFLIGPRSLSLTIYPPNPVDPIVSETNSTEATIFSNGKKIAVDNAGNVHVVYSSGDSVYYSLSTDNGATWPSEKIFIGMGKYPALVLNGKQVPTICWLNGNCLYGTKKEKSGFAKPYLVYTGAAEISLSSLSYVLNQNTNKAYLGWIEESSVGSAVKMSGYNSDTYTLSSTTSIDKGEPGAFKSPSLALDRFGNINIAWGRSGKVYYKDNAGQTEIGQNGSNPNLDIYGDKTTVVWQEETLPGIYQVVKRTKGPLGWSDKKIISYPDSLNADFPAVAVAGQYVYSKNVKDKDYDLIWNAEYENGWSMHTQNLSSAQGGLSRYPSLAFKQGWPKSKLHMLWTEEMPDVDSKGTRPPVKNLSIIVDAVPYYYVDAGTEESVIYTTQKKGNYYYGPHPDYTLDYDPLKLMYSFNGLNPQKDYLIKLTYYHESDNVITQTLAVDNNLNIQSSIDPKTTVTAESWISSNCIKDGKIEVTITKTTGDYAVCSVIALYEFDADYSKSAEDIADNGEKISIPYCYALMQSYPNPTTGKAAIKYQLAQPGKVSLKIYNTLGQVVKTLVEQNQTAGYYNVAWDGRDNAGKATANGVYFYRLESGDFKATKKMVVIR